MIWHQNSGAKPLPLNSGAMAFLVPNSILLTWHHFWSLAPRPGTQDRGCGYFMWMDDLRLHISSSSGSSTPPSYSPGTSTRPSYSPGSSRSAQNLGKAECSNCKFLPEKIKTLETKIKIPEGALKMERHPEKHTLDSAAILHELYNEMRKLSME
ncbi:hypothetical protein Tco_0169310 [Tanacetum coccineum]